MANARRDRRGSEWERFDSLSLQKVGKNQFKASIAYLDDQGKLERHEFQGTPDRFTSRSRAKRVFRTANGNICSGLSICRRADQFRECDLSPGRA